MPAISQNLMTPHRPSAVPLQGRQTRVQRAETAAPGTNETAHIRRSKHFLRSDSSRLVPGFVPRSRPPESAGRGSRSPAQHMSRRSTAKVFPQRTCADVDCGVVFQATTDAHRYCSRRCSRRSDAEREARRRYQLKHGREPRPKPPVRPCEHCGVEFQPKQAPQRFCSDKCRAARYREVNRDRLREFNTAYAAERRADTAE